MIKPILTIGLTTGLFLGWAATVSAGVLELKNGQVLTGKYVGGNAGTIRFETASGTQVVETGPASRPRASGMNKQTKTSPRKQNPFAPDSQSPRTQPNSSL